MSAFGIAKLIQFLEINTIMFGLSSFGVAKTRIKNTKSIKKDIFW